jgi:hypothetical protein
MSIKHTAIRAYAFECTYNGHSWIDDPSELISDLQTTLNNNMQYFSYSQLKVANVKNASGKKIEIEILGIVYTNYVSHVPPDNDETTFPDTDDFDATPTFSATDNDNLIYDLNNALLAVTNLTFQRIDICNDCFLEDPTYNYPGQSFQKDNS